MSGKINPRPEYMFSLKSLCKNLESEVNKLDLEARAVLHQTKVRSNLSRLPYFPHFFFRLAATWQQTRFMMMSSSSSLR